MRAGAILLLVAALRVAHDDDVLIRAAVATPQPPAEHPLEAALAGWQRSLKGANGV